MRIAVGVDGRIASTSDDGTVKVWDLANGSVRTLLEGRPHSLHPIAFSPDGNLLAAAQSNTAPSGERLDTVRLWSVPAYRELHQLVGNDGVVNGVSFGRDGLTLATTSEDGTSRIWDTRTAVHLATVASLEPGRDWAVTAPNGLFDGSPGAWQRISWRFGSNTFDVAPIEAYFNDYYYPNLLSDLIAGERPVPSRDFRVLDRRQPQVRLNLVEHGGDGYTASRTVQLAVEVVEAPATGPGQRGSGVRDLRLFRNGSLVRAWRGDVVPTGRGKAVLQTSLRVVAGENRLTAYAFNHDDVKSSDAEILLKGSESLRRSAIAYIVAIGINQYANADFNLKHAVADADAVAEELRQSQMRLGTFGNVEVIRLVDREATKASILEALMRLNGEVSGAPSPGMPLALSRLKPVQPEDAVIVYFAGHGIAKGEHFYLIPHDLGYDGARTVLDEGRLQQIVDRGISDRELEQVFEKLEAAELLLVIDACNSGQALESKEWRRGPMNSKGLAQLAYEKGMYILAAAQGYQAALESARLGHGYLTHALIVEGLKGRAADIEPMDGQILAREWFDFATRRVPELQQEEMRQGRMLQHELASAKGEERRDPASHTRQRPRAFYRREMEPNPFVIARSGALPAMQMPMAAAPAALTAVKPVELVATRSSLFLPIVVGALMLGMAVMFALRRR
jgi:uncharacterized caspase-like protein